MAAAGPAGLNVQQHQLMAQLMQQQQQQQRAGLAGGQPAAGLMGMQAASSIPYAMAGSLGAQVGGGRWTWLAAAPA